MNRILLPTDFSENAFNAIKYALQLFKNKECTFYLLNTYSPAVYKAEYLLYSPGQIGLGDKYQLRSMTGLEKLKERLENEFNNPKHHFVIHSAYSALVDEIVQTVSREEIDLVVMGTQGATGAQEILLGTNTIQLIKRASFPVIAVPSQYQYSDPKEILFPTDYEVSYRKDQLKMLLQLQADHLSQIEVLHIVTDYELSETQKENKGKLEDLLQNSSHLFHTLPNQGVIEGINNFQVENKINLLAMIQNKHTFLERLFIEPVIKNVGLYVRIPFMVIPG
ncbi:universal stress protein [Arenibacter latericius]|uniref:universal stress protein n=1 Tax=Arenibacter latericius TaxID=86104 RepID=UPI000408BBE2|nr:universal stress protein [Arenibacter latericius]MDX1363192.1 universal stress protein [Arenibacter latericius]